MFILLAMMSYRPIAINRRARFDYSISRSVLAGIVLLGHEAKSIRHGMVSLKNSFATFHNGEVWAHNIHVSPYPPANLPADYDPARFRKLLVHKQELSLLMAGVQAGKTMIIQSIGVQGRYIKLEVGLGTGKKLHDKRDTIRKRQDEREARRAMKRLPPVK